MAQDGSSQIEPVTVATILGVHGVFGQVRARVQSDVPGRFDAGQVLYILDTPYHIQSAAPQPRNQILLKFREVTTPTGARELIGALLTVLLPAESPLPEGEYFHYQLMGLQVVTEEGEELGTIQEILETSTEVTKKIKGQ